MYQGYAIVYNKEWRECKFSNSALANRNIIRAKRRKTRINYAKIAKNKKLAQISSGVVSLEKYNALQSYLLHNQNDNTTKNKEAKTINSVSLFASDNRYKENGMLSSIVLYNDLLSKKYKQFLYESNDLNFNYLSRDASNKLEKYNIKLLSRSHIKQVLLAQDNNINYTIDIFPYYGSDVGAARRAGVDVKGALIGTGVSASHGMERTHIQGIDNTLNLIYLYLI